MNLDSRLSAVLREIIFIGCCIFALSLPFDFPLKNAGIDLPLIKSFLILEVIILLFLWQLLLVCERKFDIKTSNLLLPVFTFFLLHIYSSLSVSSNMVWSLKYTFRFFSLGLMFFIMINIIDNKKRLHQFINWLFLGAGLSAIFVIVQYFFPYILLDLQDFFENVDVSPQRVRGLFGWPTNMSIYLGSFIPLLVSFLIYKPHKNYRERFFYIILLLLIFISLILSRTRGWILGLFSGLSFLWFLHLVKERDYKTLWITTIILAGLFLTSIFSGFLKFLKSDLEPTEVSRLKIAQGAIKLMRENPLKGIGPDMFFWKFPQSQHTHNIFLEAGVNLGIFGPLILFWLLYSIFKSITKGLFKDSEVFYIQAGITGSLASFLSHSQVDYFFQKHEIIGLFWILTGVGILSAFMRTE